MPSLPYKPFKIFSAAGLSLLLLAGQTAPLIGNPTGGAVVAGGATLGAAGPTLTINQSTPSAIINWQTFNIASGETTKFIVPNSGATLNRVAAGNPSQIYGNLQSNGILYLVNPSGIVVGPNGRIDTAGFMASTLDVSNQQFLQGGDLHFAGSSAASIANAGTIHALMGDVYLIANQVNNTGTITAPQGHVGLAAGNDVLFQQAGNQHLFVQATPTGTKRANGVTNAGTIRAAAAELKAAGGNAYALAINNTGVIAATGYKKVNGQVYLTSDGGSISNSGRISAQQANGNGGTIALTGTSSTAKTTTNTVTNRGTLDASATGAGGTGGAISVKNMTGATVHSGAIIAKGGQGGAGGTAEVSGQTVGFTGTVDLTAPGGKTGNLLIDPATLDIVGSGFGSIVGGQNDPTSTSIDPTTVSNALLTSDITLNADNFITFDSALTWTSANTLTLSTNNTSGSSININAPITGINGTLVIDAATGGSATIQTGSAGAINVGSFVMQSGFWNQVGPLPAFTAGDFEFQGGSFLRATGGNGAVSTPYQIADVYGLQGIASFLGNVTNHDFVLTNDIDASGTSVWNGGSGFTSIGTLANQFQGSFDGANFAIDGLHIQLPASPDNIGLFGYASGGLIQRVGLTRANITGGTNATGGLIGFANNCTVQNCYDTGTVNASTSTGDETGGLIGGSNLSIIEECYSGANVTGKDVVGGLVGVLNSGTITNCYAYGNVTGNGEVGGLVGSSLARVDTSYSSGFVTGTTNVGGFMGLTVVGGGASTANNFWDTTTSGQSIGVGANGSTGVTGETTSALQDETTFSGAGWSIGNNPSTVTWFITNVPNSFRPMLSMEYGGTVNTAHGLELMGISSNALLGGYNLGQDIDASGTTNPSDVWGSSTVSGPGFAPVGSVSGTFRGDFNGNGHAINNLYSHLPNNTAFAGLFGETSSGASIENVGLTNVNITGSEYAGGLVGNMGQGTVSNSYTTGTVATTIGNFGAGGLVGLTLATASISQSYSTAAVTGPTSMGGLVGVNNGTISNSYSTGTVTGNSLLGGLVGQNTGTITNSHTTSPVVLQSGGSGATSGGFLGNNTGTIHNSFWDTDSAGTLVVSGVGSDVTPNTTSGVVRATTAQLQTQAFINTNSPTVPAWDFTSIWTTVGDTLTPQLRGLPTTSLPSGGGSTDLLSGTAFLDSGVTAGGANLTIKAISGGIVIGTTSTLSGGTFSLSLTPTQLTNGVLLTDAVDNGNTYYQVNSTSGNVTGIDIWGATLRLMGDTATTTTLATAKGSLTSGVNYTVTGTFLSTTAGVNLNILSDFALNGVTAANDITVNHTLTSNTPNLSVLIAGRNVTVNDNITNAGGGGITLQAGNLDNGVGTVTFGGGAQVSTSGTVAIYYNPSVNPAGSAVNTTSYVNPTENYTPDVTGGATLTAYMLVNTLNDLQNVKNNLTGSYALSQNIDATPTATWNSGAGFVPIGFYDGSDSSDANTFSGVFIGQGHTISGLTVNLPASNSGAGLFGDTATAGVIENLNLTSATITGSDYAGVLAGVDNATVINVTTAGTVTGTNYVGGLAGISFATINNSSSAGNVTGNNSSGQDVGGLIGLEQGGTVTNTFSSAAVSGFNSTGGLVGNNRGTIQLSYSTGHVTALTGFDAVGGLVGYNSAGTIEQSYSTAAVTAVSSGNFLGGFVGFNALTIKDSYAAGPVTGATNAQDVGGFAGTNFGTLHNTISTGLVTANGALNVGGFAGHTQTTIENSFLDIDSSGQTQSIGDNFNNTNVDNVTTAQLTSQSFVTAHSPTAPTFDFTNIWTTVGDTLTPQIIGLPHTALPVGSGGDTLSGTAFSDSSGLNFSSGVVIDLLSGGSVIGSTTTNGSGAFTFNISASALMGGVLLTDATDKGNTFYQAITPAMTITGVDLWGSTVRVSADTATNTALGTAIGSLPLAANGIQYSVASNALTTTAGENFTILTHYTLDGNITARGILTTVANTVLDGSANVTLTGSSVAMGGTFNRTGSLAITSTSGQIALLNVGTAVNPAVATDLTLTSAQAVLLSSTNLSLGNGGLTATGTGYTSTVDANGEANGVNLFDSSITSSGNINLTGTAGYTSDGNGGLSAGQGVFVGSGGIPSLLSASGTANLSITGTFNSNITSSSLLAGVILTNNVSGSNGLSVADGRLTITGTVSQGTTPGDSNGVVIENGSTVAATGAGLVTVTGTESATSALNRAGVGVNASSLSAVNGALTINGTVTRGTADSSIGVLLGNATNVTATGTGSVAVTGNTTGSSATFNTGVYADGATLASSGASGLTINGNAGAVTGSTFVGVGADGINYNPTSAGILFTLGTSLSTTNTGGIHLTGVAGPNNSTAPLSAYGADTGVRFEPTTGAPVTVTSAGGGIAITGRSGAGTGTFFNVGVNIATAHIQDTGDGAVTVTGFSGAGQTDNSGVTIEGTTTSIQAGNGGGSSGVLTIIGYGATGVAGSQNDGIAIYNAAQLTSGGGGISITGSTGTPGNSSSGVLISTASVTTPNGALAVNSSGGGLSVGATITALTTAYSTPAGTSATLSNLNASTILSGGNFFITQSGNLVLNALTVQSLSLDVTGSITQIGRVAAGQLSINNAGSVTLTDPANVINSLGAISSSGAITIFTDPGLTLTNTVTSSSAITIAETGGPLTLASGGQVIETGTANVILAAGTNLANSNYFINDSTAGANAVQTGSFGRFFLFSSDPMYDTLGGITFAPANVVYHAVYPTSATGFTGGGNAEFFYVAGSGQVGPNAPVMTQIPNTATGGAAGAGSSIVPPVLVTQTSQIDPQTPGDGTTVGGATNFLPNGGANDDGTAPPAFSFTGTGVSQLTGQLDGGLANAASNSGQINSGDIAQLGNGQYNNVSNPQAADVLNEALGPIVYANLADALRALGDWAEVPAAANDPAAGTDGETILTGGDVAEMTGTSAKKIPLSQAPEQLQNAMKDDSLKGAGH